MATPSITADMSTFVPLPVATPEASALQGAVSYGVQQDPVRYAKLLDLQRRLGIPPAVSDGNEEQVQQDADVRSINYPHFAAANPRTAGWAANPDNAAVSGVGEIQRVAGIEQNAAQMRAYTPSFVEIAEDEAAQAFGVMSGRPGMTPYKMKQLLYEMPLSRGAIDLVGGVSGMGGNIGSFFGWHGDGQGKANLLQRIEANVSPEENTDPAAVFHGSTEGDWLMKNVAPMVPAVIASGGTSLLADTLGISTDAARVLELTANAEKAAKAARAARLLRVAQGLAVGGAFDLDQAGKTYTAVAGAGGSDDAARLAANKVALINAPANALFGATDLVPLLRDNPLLTSLGLGGATGVSGQVSQNVVTGRPAMQGTLGAAVEGAAMQGGMHVGMGVFGDHMAQAVDAAEQSELRGRSPEKFGEAMQTVFAGDQSLRIPAEQFSAYFSGKGMDPAAVAKGLGSTNYAEAVLSGGDVEVPPADFLAKLDPEHQKALLPHVVDPSTGLTATQHQEGLAELQQWAAGGGAEKLAADAAQADAETAATPEWQGVKEDLRQRYVDAGETPEVAETLATTQANVVGNLARESGRTPAELMAMYAPKVTAGSAPEMVLHQSPAGSGVDPEILHQGPLEGVERAGWRLDSPEMAEARSKAEAAEAAGDEAGAAAAAEKFNAARDADPRFKAVLAAREAYTQAREKAAGAPDDQELAKASKLAFARMQQEAASVPRYGVPAGHSETPRGWFRALPDGSFEIGKTKIGDLSTFVHEPAHAYLHMLRDLVGREGASEALKADYAKVLDFVGAKDGEALTREQQETWARANEQYLREGKAPSEGLKGVFQRFAVWLGSIYKKATDLGVELTPEIRDVFDRMYASEEGVRRAATEAGPKLFSSAEEAGWTEDEYKRYAEEHGVSVAAAKAHVVGMLHEAAVRDQSQSWREEVRNVRQAQTELIDARPEYKAIRALRKGELDGTPLTLNKEALVKQFGEERVAALQKLHPGLYRADGNADAGAAAELHGFASAEDMMRSLEAAPRRNAAIEQATRAYMTAKHGDLRFDGTLDSKALLALESRRGDGLYRELKALKARVAKMDAHRQAMRDIAIAPIEAYREAAHRMIESKAVADLEPTRHLDASRKYSREAFDALRKGNVEAAADAKHKELMNHFLFREATEAKEFVGKFEDYARRALGRTVQSNLGLAGSDYRAQFNRLLYRYGLSRPPAEMPDRPLSAWADEMYEQGKEPAIDPAMLSDDRAVHYRQASVAEVRNLRDALKNVKTLAYQEMHAVVNGRKIAFADAKTEMLARARASIKVHPESVFEEDRSLADAARDKVNRGVAPLIRTEFLMKRLDGGVEGPWHDNLWNLAADAQGVERELQEGVTKVIGDVLQNMPDGQRMRMLEKVTLPGWGEITRKRLISMALNLGNEGNLDRLRKTFVALGKDPEAVGRIPQLLSREDWQLVQGLWDSLKPMGERMNEMERRLTGLPPVMVTPTPLHIEQADGGAIDLDGGYYPIAMDPRYSERAQQQDVNVTARNLMESGYGRAATSRGYTKERTGFAGPLLLDYEQVLTQHIAKASKDISHREFILAANRFLQDPEIQRTLRETVGPGYESQMMPWLRTIVNDRNGSAVQGLGDLSNWMGRLRTNVVEASLCFKVSTLLLQLTHASSIFLHTSAGSFSQALVDFLAHPSEMTEQIRNLSPNEMKNRGENIDRDMRSVLQNGIEGPKLGKVIAKAGMFPVKMMDHVLSFPLWLSVYRDALAKHAELPDARAKHLAMHEADGAVRMGLGSNAPKDLPAIMRKNDLWKMITTLGGFENLKLNQIVDAGYGLGRDRSVGKFTYRMLMAAIIPAVVGAYVQGNRPKDDDNPAAWAAKRALLFPPETVPLMGNVVRAIDEGSDARFTPIIDVVNKGVTAGVQATSDKEDKDWTGIALNASQAVGQAAGVAGTVQATRTLRYMHRASQGEISDPNAWDAVVGAPHK